MATSFTQIDRDAAQEQIHEIVRQLLAELGSRHAFDAVRPSAHLERDLGLGSLERVELVERIEQTFAIRLPDEAAAQVNTLEDLGEAVARAAANGNAAAAPEIFSATMRAVRRHTEPAADGAELAAQLERAETLTEVLERHARAHPDRPQIFLREDAPSGGQQPEPHQITYGDLLSRSRAVASSLVERGLAPGQAVAMMLPTCREFFYTFYGTLMAGGIPVPIYPPFRADRIEEYAARQSAILKNAEARLLVTFRQAEAVAKMLKPRVPSLVGVVNAEKLAESAQPGVAAPRYHPRASDIAFIQYTSGSTGEPKGVVLTHANLLANMRAIKEALDIQPSSAAVSWLPLYHDMGLIGAWLTILYSGVPVAVMSPMAFLTRPERWLWAIHHHRGTITAAPNFAYELCVRKIADKDIEGLDLSSWRLALNGAEPVQPETMERFAERFGPYGFRREAMLPVYGLAEASLAVTVPPLDRLPRVDQVNREIFQREGRAVPVEISSVGAGLAPPDENGARNVKGEASLAPTDILSFVSTGVAVPRHEVRIADEYGDEAPERVEGQLWFRGPSATSGYYRNPEATKKILRANGWVDSGDRAYRADGEIFITGRVKDIIIKAGRNLYPHEVEEIAGGVAGVRRGCIVAFGARDEQSGTERLVVVAETRERSLPAAQKNEIAAEMRAKISDSLGLPPDVIELVAAGSIPKTSSGKLRRADTKKLFLEGALGKGKPPAWMQVAKLGAASGAHSARSGLRRAFDLLYGAYAALAFAIFIVPTWLGAYFAPSKRAACRITQIGTRIYFGMIGCRLDVRGREHLESGGPFVLVSNHTSFFDVVMFLAILKIPYRFVSKMEVGSWPFIGTFIRRREDFTFNREDRAARLAQAEAIDKVLREGESVLVFPEGTFTPHEGLRPFQLGAFKSAVVTGRPVLPIAIRGMRGVFRDETKLPKLGSVTVTICPPIFPRVNESARAGHEPRGNHWQEILRLRDETRAAVGEHCGEPVL